MILENFTLKKLKEIMKELVGTGNLVKQPRVYNINKFDTIVLLRNCGCCDESKPTHLAVSNGAFTKTYRSDFKNKFFKGKNTGFKIITGKYVINFE